MGSHHFREWLWHFPLSNADQIFNLTALYTNQRTSTFREKKMIWDLIILEPAINAVCLNIFRTNLYFFFTHATRLRRNFTEWSHLSILYVKYEWRQILSPSNYVKTLDSNCREGPGSILVPVYITLGRWWPFFDWCHVRDMATTVFFPFSSGHIKKQ